MGSDGHVGVEMGGVRRAPRGVAIGAAVVLIGGLAAALVTGRAWIFEAIVGLVLLTGIGLACGALDRRQPRRDAPTTVAADSSPELRAALEVRLACLDPLEHRRLDLGDPWPSVVVGPTGVAVVAPASAAHRTVARRLQVVVEQIEVRLAGVTAGPLPVRGLVVVDHHDRGMIDLDDGPVRYVAVTDLLDHLARGPLVAMATVAAVHARLAGDLAPDLPTAS